MTVTILGNPLPIYDLEIGGPYPPYVNVANPAANSAADFAKGLVLSPASWTPLTAINSTPRIIWEYISLGAGGTAVQSRYKGIASRAMTCGAAPARLNQALEGVQMVPLTDGSGLSPSYVNPSWKRVSWLGWAMAMSVGATLDAETGLYLTAGASNIVTNSWPTPPSPSSGGGFGVIGDGAGNWNWRSWAAGTTVPPLPITETVSLAPFIPDPEQWNTFEVVMVSAAGGRAASLQLIINGVVALARDWINAPALIGLGPSVGADSYKYVPIVQVGPALGTLHFGDWTYRCGRFLPGGGELLS